MQDSSRAGNCYGHKHRHDCVCVTHDRDNIYGLMEGDKIYLAGRLNVNVRFVLLRTLHQVPHDKENTKLSLYMGPNATVMMSLLHYY